MPVVYNRFSTVFDLSGSAKGQELLKKTEAMMASGMSGDETDGHRHLGEGAKNLVENMRKEMPLTNLCALDVIEEEKLDELLADLNS